jgi:UDP-N-acetylmuramoyl-tripeptide--D-alanyl-D-alanine ligase
MFPCTVSQLRNVISGQTVDLGPQSDLVTGVSIDSRSVRPGDAFFALPGDRSHGILFAADAVARGAVCVVADSARRDGLQRDSHSERGDAAGLQIARLQSADTIEIDERIVRTANVQQAMQDLAAWNRRQSSALVVGITGSVGKTTTRQLITAVLSTQFCGIQSPRNFNNELGLPLSLSLLNADHDFAVLEMGAGRPGDLTHLAQLAQPEFAVVTEVSAAHLQTFQTLDAIRRTKQELVEAIDASGTVFLNADNPDVLAMAAATTATVVTYGCSDAADVRAHKVTAHNGECTFHVDGTRFQFTGGRQLLPSALAALAVGRVTGIADCLIAKGLASFQADAGRGRIVARSPWLVVDDTYNASPASVLGAIRSLADWPDARHRILVLGDMLELGSSSESAHFDVGRELMTSSVNHTLVYGTYADAVVAGARSTGLSNNHISSFRDLSTLQSMLDCLLTPGDVVLLKGSRSTQMERVVQWLLNQIPAVSQRHAA